MKKVLSGFVFCVALAFVADSNLRGQNPGSPPAYTVITVEKMDCASCAKRIAGKLYEVAGVEKVQMDVEKKLLWVHPKAGLQLSPRSLWEAAEKGNGGPSKLHGPHGVFTSKPQK